MSIPTPRISVVIPTLNRAEAIVNLVDDLCKQVYPTFEIVVVDSSRDENVELQRRTSDQRIRVLRVDPLGTCFSRNSGVKAATGDIVVFTDDDVRINDPNFLLAHAANYSDPSIGGVGGRVIDQNTTLNREQTGPVCRVTSTGRVYGNANVTTRQDINAPRGANMSYRRQVIIDVGGFDERFRGNAMREETDFSLRVVKAGWRIVFDPATDLIHLALAGGSRTTDRLTWYRDFFFNESYFFLKHFPGWYLPILLMRKSRAMAACWLYYGHGNPRWLVAPWVSFREASKLVTTRNS